MRRWWTAAAAAASEVADRPTLWLPGALAWSVGVGWIALLVGVARPPSQAELTFLGARTFTSGAWPWNALLLGTVTLALCLAAFGLAAAGEAAILRGRRARVSDVARIWLLGISCAAPAAVGIVILGLAVVLVAPVEFNAPDEGIDPVARTALRLAPVLIGIAIAAAGGAAVHAAAARDAVNGSSFDRALRSSVPTLTRAGRAAVIQIVALLVARVVYLVLAAMLLRVLWEPIRERLASAGIDPAVALLLVGFVAIWLCLVLGGGALHAWSSVSWSRVVVVADDNSGRSRQRMETSTGQ
jgi:hypothetical protein